MARQRAERVLKEALREIIHREATSQYSGIYAAPGEFAAIARAALIASGSSTREQE